MTLDSMSDWLRCPVCSAHVGPRARLSIACENGHSFDCNKRGYVSMLPARSRLAGDSAAMLDARDAFLARGHYRPLADALDGLLPHRSAERIVDAGCGTGYYLRQILGARTGASALAVDLSPSAVARAVRGDDRIDGLVADVWSPLPVRTGAATAILNVFAPRNAAEFARVLASDGRLVVAVPEQDHLNELRAHGLTLGVQQEKLAKLQASLDPLFVLEESRHVRFMADLDATDVSTVIGMGPSAHHFAADTPLPDRSTVTVAVRVLRFRKRAGEVEPA